MTQLDGLAGAGIDGTGVELGEDRLADDVGNEQEDDLIVLDVLVGRAEDVFEQRDLGEAGGTGESSAVGLGEDAGKDAGLAFLELDDLLDGALGDDGLGNAGDGGGAALGGDLDLELEADLVVVVDGGRHVDVDADINVSELGLDAERDGSVETPEL